MEMTDGFIVVRRPSGLIPIQRVTPQDVYAALRVYKVGEAKAAGVASGLITVKIQGVK